MFQPKKYSLNIKQSGEALELLSSLGNNLVSLVFLIRSMSRLRMFCRLITPYILKVIIRF